MKRYKYRAKITETIQGVYLTEEDIDVNTVIDRINDGDLSEVEDSENFQVVEILEITEETDEQESQITVFTTGCPKCKILEAKLKEKNIQYKEVTDIDEMKAMGLNTVPWLKTEAGEMLNFTDAMKWLNSLE